MNKAWVRAVKEMDERPHPNLQKQVYLNIEALETRKNLNNLSKKQWKKLISEVVQNQGIKTYPDRYPFEKEERIRQDEMEMQDKESKLFSFSTVLEEDERKDISAITGLSIRREIPDEENSEDWDGEGDGLL